jgi:hypothetical protein
LAMRRLNSSLVCLNAAMRSVSGTATAAGSGNPQCKRRTWPRKTGHSSSAHSVISVSISSAGIFAIAFERCCEILIPISLSAAIASGRTLVGREPADHIFTPGGARERAIPSAIWLRAEFATHRNRIPFNLRFLHSIVFAAKPQRYVHQTDEYGRFDKRADERCKGA